MDALGIESILDHLDTAFNGGFYDAQVRRFSVNINNYDAHTEFQTDADSSDVTINLISARIVSTNKNT